MLQLLGLLPLATEVTVSIGKLIAGGTAIASGTAIVGNLVKGKEDKKEKIEIDFKSFTDDIKAYYDLKYANSATVQKNLNNMEKVLYPLAVIDNYKEIISILSEDPDCLEHLNKVNSMDDIYLYLYEIIEENEELINKIKSSKTFDIDVSDFNEAQKNFVFRIKKSCRHFNDEFCKIANLMEENNEEFKNMIKILREEE